MESKISITLDSWTSPSQMAFMCITAHYISQDWKQIQLVLDFVSLDGPHTGENLADALLNTLKKYHISEDKASYKISFSQIISCHLAKLLEYVINC